MCVLAGTFSGQGSQYVSTCRDNFEVHCVLYICILQVDYIVICKEFYGAGRVSGRADFQPFHVSQSEFALENFGLFTYNT